jgi:hypothetical protein
MPLSPESSQLPVLADQPARAPDDRLTTAPGGVVGTPSAAPAAAAPSRLHRFLLGAIACLVLAMLVAMALLLARSPSETNSAPTAKLPTPAPTPVAARPEDDPSLWRALGGLTRAHLYQSNLSIGLLADGVEEDLYSLPEARKLLGNSARVLQEVELELDRLPETGLAAEDRKLFNQVREALRLLRAQARELGAYWDSGDKAVADRFHKTRARTVAQLDQLIRLGP